MVGVGGSNPIFIYRKKVYGKRGKRILFPLFPYIFTFSHFSPWGKMRKDTFFPWIKMGLDPPLPPPHQYNLGYMLLYNNMLCVITCYINITWVILCYILL